VASATNEQEVNMGEALRVGKESIEAFNAHDEERIKAGYTQTATLEAPGDVQLEGPDAATEYAMSWLRAFPDARVTVENEFEAGDWVLYQFTFQGTHKEPLVTPEGEVPPTNRQIKGRGAQFIRVEDGKIAEEHLYWDQVQILTQLGLMPEPQAATA
jgi:steroid delta-isomerase-like uncharacterized protein